MAGLRELVVCDHAALIRLCLHACIHCVFCHPQGLGAASPAYIYKFLFATNSKVTMTQSSSCNSSRSLAKQAFGFLLVNQGMRKGYQLPLILNGLPGMGKH